METILAIDDNNDNLISLRAIIKDAFPESMLYTALDGLTGIELAIAKDPDVILLDILMPGMDGFEVCHRLKQNECLQDIPVVFLTAIRDSKQSRIKALEIGAEAFLSKPIDITELTAQIRAMLKIKTANARKRDENKRLYSLVAERTRELEQSQIEMVKLLGELKVENEISRKTQALLLESENRYQLIDQSSLDCIYSYDIQGRFTHANSSLCKLLGLNANQIVGKTHEELNFPQELCDSWSELHRRVYETNATVISETYLQNDLKSPFHYYEVVLNPMHDELGKIIGIAGTTRDISERKLSEEKIRTLSNAVEQGPSSIMITNANGEIIFINNRFTYLTQYKLEDVKGRKPRVFNPGHMPEKEFENLWNTLKGGRIWKGEVLNRKKDKLHFWEDTVISTLMNSKGEIMNYILIMNDITEKKLMLDELIAAKDKAEESDRLKSAFLANMSHEIRTPLNSIIGFSELMLEAGFNLDKSMEFIKMINDSGNSLLSIINDILDISIIEAGQVKIINDKFSVNKLISQIYDEYKFYATQKGLELKFDFSISENELFIDSDENKMRQILVNFLGNALKFTKKGCIEIGFEKSGDFVKFHVKDTGIGIPLDFQDRIFERFRQVESNYTREYGGNGLGLAISKKLVELLGGAIGLNSELGKGSNFFFTIPFVFHQK